VFYQTIPLRYLTLNPNYKKLEDLQATHFSLGLKYQNDLETTITLEAYHKAYDNLLIDPYNPQILVSQLAVDSYFYPGALTNAGKGWARGIELMIRQRLLNQFFGLFNLSLFRCKYRDYLGIERNSVYDNRYILNLTFGYRPSARWELSLRYTLIGGGPHPPFDLERTRQYQTLVYDLSRFNADRYPDFSKLNLRFERRFFFGSSNLSVYLDLWNALNNQTPFDYTWDSDRRQIVGDDYQLPLLPLLGVEWAF
jgi:hypothetical protein